MIRPALLLLPLACALAVGASGLAGAEPASDGLPPPAAPAEARVERFTVRSPSMDREIKAWVVLPPAYSEDNDTRFPILHALHGRAAPYDTFANMPRLRAALADMPMIVAGFDADIASFYLDSPFPLRVSRNPADETLAASRFATFFFDEFVPAIEARHRADPSRRMLTGFSMGGFGAFHYLLSRPDAFSSVSALSGVFLRSMPPPPAWRQRLEPLLGPAPETIAAIAFLPRIDRHAAVGVALPPTALFCGAEDGISIADNRAFHADLTERGIRHEYHETPGKHDWAYWSSIIPRVLDFHWKNLPGRDPVPTGP